MFGFWLPIGLLIASVILFTAPIAKRRKRLSAETYRLTVVIWSITVIVLSIGIPLQKRESKGRRAAGTHQSHRSAAAAFALR